MTDTPTHPRRSDAVKNREHILEIAHDEFAADPDVSLNQIAKRSGVGAGTLYRHFPTRESLILAVYRHDVQRLRDSVGALLAAHEPLDAFRRWFERLAKDIRLKHGLGEALHTAAVQEVIDETYAPVTAAIAELIEACERSGDFRAGIDPGDVLLLMGFMWRVAPDAAGRTQARRMMEIVIEGLRPTT